MNTKHRLLLYTLFIFCCLSLSAQTVIDEEEQTVISPEEFFEKFKERIDNRNQQATHVLQSDISVSTNGRTDIDQDPLVPVGPKPEPNPIGPDPIGPDPIWPYPKDRIDSIRPELGSSKTVGEIRSSTQVNQIGAMTVDVVFDGYSDPRNFAPQIGLSYNHMAGTSPYGYGWGLSGVSMISRTNRVLYYDNKVSAPNLTKDDAFTLDGKRLIELSRTSSQIQYKTEAGNIKVVANYTGDAISSFVVYYTNGDVSTYDINDGVDFYITSSKDKIGNVITYSYTLCTGHYRLSEVTYGAGGKATIEFKYGNEYSDSPFTIFKNGKLIKYDYYLSQVQTKYSGLILKNYLLEYAKKDNRRILEKVRCTSGGTENIEPLIFDYAEDNTTKTFTSTQSQLFKFFRFEKPSEFHVLSAKISGGNDSDGIIMYQEKNPYMEFYREGALFRSSTHYMKNMYNGDEDILLATHIDNSIALGYKITTGEGFIDLFTCDLDGFQDDEIVKVNQNVDINREELKFTVYKQSFYGFSKKYERIYHLAGLVSGNLQPKYFYTGDFNGDGKTDVMVVTSSEFYRQNPGTICTLLDLENDKILYRGSPFDFHNVIPRSGDPAISSDEAFNRSDKLFPLDFDGDGKTDVGIVKDDGTYYYTFKGSSSLTCELLAKSTNLKKDNFKDRTFGAGDFNGDGNIDIIVSPTKGSNTTWKIFASNGHYDFKSYNISLTSRSEDDVYVYQDVDLDGQTDLVKRSKNKLGAFFIYNFTYSGCSWADIKDNTCLVQTDVREKNKWYSLLSIQNDGKIVKMNLARDVLKNLVMSSFTNSLGLQTKFRYGWLNDAGADFYHRSCDAVFPYDNFQGRLAVCNYIEAVANGTTTSRVNYSYYNAIIHHQGLGFRGFSDIYAYDDIQNWTNTKKYDPYHFSNLLSEDNYKKKISYTYSTSIASNKIISNELTKREFTDKTNGVTSTTVYSYDGYGSMTKSDETFSDGSEVVVNREYYNVDDETHNIIGLLTKESKTTITSEGEQANESKENSYNDNNMVVTERTKINDNTILTTSYEYDTNLNISRKASKYFSSEREETEIYVTNELGQLTSRTDKYGLQTSYLYDSCGRLASSKDARGLITKYGYDCWGNLASTTTPDSIKTTSKAKFCSVAGLDAIYYTETTAPNKPIVRTYYNMLGNVVRKEEQHFDGSFIKTDFVYDSRNRLIKQSLPYRNTCNGWKTTAYDYYDRPISITYPSGKIEKTSYSGLNVSNTVDGIVTTKTVDCLGNITKAVTPTGTTLYHYNALGKLLSIEAPEGIETIFEYDQYGRKKTLDDPSLGVTTYEYNSEGQLARTTDARGYITDYNYDIYNRPIEKILAHEGKSATFQYDDYGNLVYQEESDGSNKSFLYDRYNRLTSKLYVDKVGNRLQTDYEYRNGNIVSAQYSSSYGPIATENYVYAYGNLAEVKLNGEKVIYKVDSEDENGNIIKYTAGGLTHERIFDLDGRTLEIKDYNNDHIYNGYRYTYDVSTGNLMTRQDFAHSFSESFIYDEMNRLVAFDNMEIQYNDLGNITYSSYAGKYTYNRNKPYSVETVDNPNGFISSNPMSIGYNTQMRVTSIEENGKKMIIGYDIDENRTYSILTSPISKESYQKFYLGERYEIIKKGDDVKEIFYIGNDAYSADNVLVRKNRGNWVRYDICRDNLGSIVTIVSEINTIIQDVSYDAWGNMRDPSTGKLIDYKLFLDRGYTGHEYLTVFDLYNMNARLYSPKTCRFLSPDPIVSLSLNDQNFNRYSYCLNNPFKYTDPSGKFAISASLIIIGSAALIGGVTNIVYQAKCGNIHNFWEGLGAFGIGAVAGGAGAWAGLAACAAVGVTAVGVVGGAISGAVTGGVGTTILGFCNQIGYNQPMNWSFVGKSIVGGLIGGAIAGGAAGWYFKGQNWWVNKVSKGTPTPQATTPASDTATETQTANSVGPGEAQTAAKSASESTTGISRDQTLKTITEPQMSTGENISPYRKGEIGVQRAMEEFKEQGGTVLSREVSIKVDNTTVRADFVGYKDDMLYIVEVKNGPKAGFTPNQKIAYPKLMLEHAPFSPIGSKALQIENFRDLIINNRPYTGNYTFEIIHYY